MTAMEDYSRLLARRQRIQRYRKRRRMLFRGAIVITSIVALVGIQSMLRTFVRTSASSPDITPNQTPQVVKKEYNSADILAQIETITASASGTYSVYMFDIAKQTGFGINEQTVMDAASVNKIPILAALYHLAGKEDIDLEKVIVIQEKDIQDYGTGSIRYNPPDTPYSIKTLAKLMMEKSDNTAAYVLASHIVGLTKIQNLVEEWGLTQTDMRKNTSSVKDQATLLIKIYKGGITTQALTQEMLDFMDKSDFDDRIPRGLPDGVVIYHKTGDAVAKVHDVGLIASPTNPYYLGIFTSEIRDVEKTKQTISEISRVVYNAFHGL